MDLSDCVNDVQISSLQYCSDQDEIHATVVKSFVRVEVPLVRSSCSSVGATTFTGSGDPPSAAPFCYTGSKLGETVKLKVNTCASEAGSFDLTGSGLESISCLGKSFTKSGQCLVADLSDCVSLATVSKLEYCSDQANCRHHQGRFHLDGRCVVEGRVRFDGRCAGGVRQRRAAARRKLIFFPKTTSSRAKETASHVRMKHRVS